jgi:exodeoxyribonuclease VII small subunit
LFDYDNDDARSVGLFVHIDFDRTPVAAAGLTVKPRYATVAAKPDANPMKKAPAPPAFEESLSELETIVAALEKGDLTLEASLGAFERGVNLTRACREALEHAEQRVRILTEGRPDTAPEPFLTSHAPAPDHS